MFFFSALAINVFVFPLRCISWPDETRDVILGICILRISRTWCILRHSIRWTQMGFKGSVLRNPLYLLAKAIDATNKYEEVESMPSEDYAFGKALTITEVNR